MFGRDSEPVQLYRNCAAVLIPSGDEVILRKGTNGFITQALGGSFTVYVDGSLFRIDGGNADALGKDPVPPPQLPPEASREDLENLVWEQMKTCFDPEIPINIVDLGLIYRCETVKLEDGQYRIEVDMTLTAPGCGMGDILVLDVRSKLEIIPKVKRAAVELVFDPPWRQDMMSEAARLQTGMY
ncbi:MAG: putative Fe-S cluster assembly protein SufT [Gammaproteobacteria bacterium]|jgi:probable FeS assembly SUF system protein SufT|nr:MAG: putative Fe-S cluster assembly protein SufT [Gammaproteobacteria bacterium]